jgi:methionyl-tRNA formyltransferase
MNTSALRIAFAGTPEFAASHLQALIDAGFNIVAAYTQPDRPAGRGKQDKASPVKTLALASNIPVLQPHSLKDEHAQTELKALNLDVLIVVAYGLILPQAILDIPKFGCINVHASLLPRWRGAAPIERAILAGDEATGITIMQMDAGLDTGDMLLKKSIPISSSDNSASLTAQLTELGKSALIDVLKQIEAGSLSPQTQDNNLSTYAEKLEKNEALISWDKDAKEILRQINAFYPRSPAYCFYNDQRLRIIKASVQSENSQFDPGTIVHIDQGGMKIACNNSVLLVEKIQLPGKAETSIKDFLNGRKDYFVVGKKFSSTTA